MNRSERSQKIKQLKQQGFRVVKDHPNLYINETGSVYSLEAGKYLKMDSKKRVLVENSRLSVAKLILSAFEGIPYNSSHVRYIDGNKENLTAKNIEYVRISHVDATSKVDNEQLMTTIRCYFEVNKRFKVKDFVQTKLYLQGITEARQFFTSHSKEPNLRVFQTYIKEVWTSKVEAAKAHEIGTRDGLDIINGFLNQLIKEVLQDLKNGVLSIQGFEQVPRTKSQILKDWQAERDKIIGHK